MMRTPENDRITKKCSTSHVGAMCIKTLTSSPKLPQEISVHFFLVFGHGRPTLPVQSLNMASRLLEMRLWGNE